MSQDTPDIDYQRTLDPLWKKPKKVKPGCKTCGSILHATTFCFMTKKKRPKLMGKQAIKWQSERKLWIEKNPPDINLFWYCHYCGVKLVVSREDLRYKSGEAMILTIDHIIARSSNPKLRYDFSNMVPCCSPDNRLKGSTEYARFCERWYPHLLKNNNISVIDTR